nr:hypothetical protein BdHM001_13180 [Bdellovibrio sp. HM001]
MYGSCVLNKVLACLLLVLLLPLSVWAQAQQATVVIDGALVYQDADFDAPVISTLKLGGVYSISTKKKGPFYKIRLKPGYTGWISDTDIKPGVIKITAPEKTKPEREEKRKKPFFATRYRGPVLQYTNYMEDTLGKERTDGLLFYGAKFNGFNTMFTGEIYTDANILFFFGAPSYYQDYTKRSADGFIFIADFLLQTVMPQGKNMLFYYGFGPMFKYSHFNLDVPSGASNVSYSADDMSLGAVFDLGTALRMGDWSLRGDVKYYWERTQYLAFGLSFSHDF